MSHDEGAKCHCVKFHSPRPRELQSHHIFPLGFGGPANGQRIWLCPNGHLNLHEYLRLLIAGDGKVEWAEAKHFSPTIRRLAQRGYDAIQAAKAKS